jgi:hypothetical protein
MEGMMRQVLAIAAAAVGLALLGTLTCAGCAIGRDHAASPHGLQLLASHSTQSDRLIVDGLGLSPMDNASIDVGTSSAQHDHGCWFDLDLAQCD